MAEGADHAAFYEPVPSSLLGRVVQAVVPGRYQRHSTCMISGADESRIAYYAERAEACVPLFEDGEPNPAALAVRRQSLRAKATRRMRRERNNQVG